MTMDKIQVVLLTLAFIVPGFIMNSTFSLFTPRKGEAKEILLLRYLTFSTLNLVACFWIIRLVVIYHAITRHPFWAIIGVLVITFISPVFLGIMVGAVDQCGVVGKLFSSKLFRRLKLNAMHPTPNAWDWKFAKICTNVVNDGGRWIIVRLSDGSEVLGQFSAASFASSDTSERDLYLECIFDKNLDEEWVVRDRSDGILIKAETILSIEFIKDEIVQIQINALLIEDAQKEETDVRGTSF